MSRMLNTRLGLLVVAGCIGVIAGCSDGSMSDWDWFGMKKKEEKPRTRATAGTDRPSSGEAAAAAPAKTGADDAKAREVDQKVEQYVSSMNPRYQPGYESNDFNSKIRRQEDPNRHARIQQTATRHRNGDTGPDRTLTDDSKMSPPASSDGSPVYGARTAEPGSTPTKNESPTSDADNGRPRLADPSDANDPLVKPQPAMQRDDGAKKPTAPGADRANPANKPTDATPGATNKPVTEDEPFDDEVDASEAESSAASLLTDAKTDPAPAATKRPPVITNLSVEASNEPMAKTPDARAEGPSTPASLSPQKETVIVDTLKQRIEEQEAKVAADPNNIEEQFRLRILYLASGQDEKALAAIDGINADVLEIMRAQLSALMTARSSAQRDPATWANRQMEAIEKLRHLVAERADLRVSKVVICRSISQFGQYEPIDPPTFKVGAESRFLLYVPIENFKCERTESGQFRTLLSLRFSLIDPEGRERWTDKIENVEDISRDRRSDFFFGYPENGLKIPRQLGEGEYTIKVEVEDVLAQKINSNTVRFKLVP